MHFDINILILISLSLFFMLFGIFYSKNFKSLSLYLNAGRSVKSWSLTSSIVASCFGVWILIGPAEAATWGGLGAVIGYALGQACPYLAFRIFGKRLRTLMPNGNSLTQFVYVRYGLLAHRGASDRVSNLGAMGGLIRGFGPCRDDDPCGFARD